MCTFQGTALYRANLLATSQKMKEEKEEEMGREASVIGKLRVPSDPELSVCWSPPW